MPEAVIPDVGARVMGLNDPAVKMAKTHSDVRGHAVALLDDAKEIERTFKRAVTDSGNEIVFSEDPAKAGVNNLLGIYKAVTGRSNDDVERDFEDARGYGDLKSRVAEVVIEELRPVQERYHRLIDDVGELDALMARGAEQAEAVSGPKIDEVKERHRPGASREGRGMSDGIAYHPTLDEMRRLAGSGNMAPVYREMRVGSETPGLRLPQGRPAALLVPAGERRRRRERRPLQLHWHGALRRHPHRPGRKAWRHGPARARREGAGGQAGGRPSGRPAVQRRRGRLHVV